MAILEGGDVLFPIKCYRQDPPKQDGSTVVPSKQSVSTVQSTFARRNRAGYAVVEAGDKRSKRAIALCIKESRMEVGIYDGHNE